MELRSMCWPPSISFAKSALLASLGARCPSIQKFDYAYSSQPEGTSDAICEAVCGWRDLIHLTTGVLNTQALAHLASLPSLKSLHFVSYDFVDDPRPKPIPAFISELEEMSIGAASLPHLTRCLKNIPSLSCRSLELRIDRGGSEVPYDPVDITDFIVSFSECFSPALEQLDVEFSFNYVAFSEDVLADSRFAFGFDVIAPLLPFSRLTKLDLGWFCTSHVVDDALKDMVQSWPQLERFSFGTEAGWLVPPSLTFIGLVHLIQHCRHLREIEMSFHAFPIDTNSEPFSITIPNENVTFFSVGVSPIDDAMAVACQLHALMPNLAGVYHWDRDGGRTLASFRDFAYEWDKAEEYLKVFTKGAKMREELAQGSQGYLLPA
jgi:hypothetical protein